jgi:predicted chitinase
MLQQLFTLFRDTKWIAAVSLVLSLLLYVPAQICELYRAILADREMVDLIQFYAPLFAIGVFVWFGANQVALESTSRQPTPHSRALDVATWLWPVALGVLPIFASAVAQYQSIPAELEKATANLGRESLLPGSAFYQFDDILAKTVGEGLKWSSLWTLGGALVLAVILAVTAVRFKSAFSRPNRNYFVRWKWLGLTVAGIFAITCLFLYVPVVLPQHLGTFTLIALFGLLVVGFCIHVSLTTIRVRFPYFPVIFFLVLMFSWADLNDNHQIRLLDRPPSRSTQSDVATEFARWFASRDDIQQYKDEYPVYVVAAQGGGIYAAYESAIFLARMQDQCPAFRKHLFAISSVSGGSVGSAVFASVLDALPAANSDVPCPGMSRYFERSSVVDKKSYEAGIVEGYVRGVLSPKNDLLSPLIAATLFGDFSQRFIPAKLGFLDRARALEFALEQAGADNKGQSLLSQEYVAHWADGKQLPALLLNATDAASGRRVVFSPFTFRTKDTSAQIDSLVPFQALSPTQTQQSLNLRLSTAAFVSARFPWVSPAATVPLKDDFSPPGVKKMRLVDGGYFDNSGVETAVDLMQSLDDQVKMLNGAGKGPKITLKLIVLGGGQYPVRHSFALGETMEPIRTLLSTRESRAYIAINKASRVPELRDQIFERKIGDNTEQVTIKPLRLVRLRKHSYELPLGWAMSLRTREIVEYQSGRFWDCDPSSEFTQADEVSGSSADCVQLLIGHELNGTLDRAIQELAVQQHYSKIARPARHADPRLDKPAVVRCFADANPSIRLPQARLMVRLLKEWDYYPDAKDQRILAYILGTALHETSELRVFSENLSYKTAERIVQVFARQFNQADRAAALADASQYVNAPEKLANRVYGRADLGNDLPGDGWRYRGRGILPLTGKEDYRNHQALLDNIKLVDDPDLMLNNDVATRVLFSHFLKNSSLDPYFVPGQDARWVEARATVAGGRSEAVMVAERSKKVLDCLPK